jgi:hypothetical protein
VDHHPPVRLEVTLDNEITLGPASLPKIATVSALIGVTAFILDAVAFAGTF